MILFCGAAAAADVCLFPEHNWRAEFPTISQSESTNASLSDADMQRLNEARAALTFSFEYVPQRASNRFRVAAALVGRLEVLAGGNSDNPQLENCVDYCTATLLDEGTLLTASHCLTAPLARAGTEIKEILFRYGGEGESEPGALYRVDPVALETSVGTPEEFLDFAILKLVDEVPDLSVSGLDLLDSTDRDDWRAAEIAIIGYPLGTGLMMSRRGCYLAENRPLVGTIDGRKFNFRHVCSTTQGMSGAPILDELTGKIVGIHTAAGLRSSSEYGIWRYSGFNKGIVLAEIRKSSAILKGGTTTPVSIEGALEENLASLGEMIENGDQRVATLDVSFAIRGTANEDQLRKLVDRSNQILQPATGNQCPVALHFVDAAEVPGTPRIRSSEDFINAVSQTDALFVIADRIEYCGGPTTGGVIGCTAPGKAAIIRVDFGPEAMHAISFLHELGHLAGLAHEESTFMGRYAQLSNTAVTQQQCAKLVQFTEQRYLTQTFGEAG